MGIEVVDPEQQSREKSEEEGVELDLTPGALDKTNDALVPDSTVDPRRRLASWARPSRMSRAPRPPVQGVIHSMRRVSSAPSQMLAEAATIRMP
jgi:hypothetical protein